MLIKSDLVYWQLLCVCACAGVCAGVCARHLSVRAEGETGDAMSVSIPQQRHGLGGEGVPDAHVRILPHLTRRHQGALRMQGQTGEGKGRKTSKFMYLVTLCRKEIQHKR